MTPDFMQWIISQTGMAGIAAFSLWLMNQRHVEHEKRLTELLEESKQRNTLLIETIKGNTEALAKVSIVVERCTLTQYRAGER